MLHTGVPPHALDEFHRLSRPEHRTICNRDGSRSRSHGRDKAKYPAREKGRNKSKSRDVDRVHQGGYTSYVPNKQDFTVKFVEKKPSEKELKSILKNKDSRIFFDDVKGPYYGFNTYSEHPVVYDGFKFPTAEHLLLYFKVGPYLGPRIVSQVGSWAAFSSQNGRGSAATFASNRPSLSYGKQQRGLQTRSRFTGDKRSSSTFASWHFSFRDFGLTPDTDGSGALAQVHPTQGPQENVARHWRSPHYFCELTAWRSTLRAECSNVASIFKRTDIARRLVLGRGEERYWQEPPGEGAREDSVEDQDLHSAYAGAITGWGLYLIGT